MFFILSKISYFFIAPFTWLLLAIVLYLWVKRPVWKRRLKWSILIIALVFSNTFLFKEYVRLWEVPAVPVQSIAHHQVGIVLGGMFEYDNDTERLSIRRGGDRIWQAIDLYKRNKIDKILISGDNGYVSDRGLHESKQLKEVLIRWGVKDKDVITEERSKNTAENAKETVALLQKSYPHFNSFLLITSAKHMRRAQACFTKLGLKTTAFSTDPYVGPTRSYHWDEFIIPDGSNFDDWFTINKEILGYVVYDIMGYI